MNLSIVPKDIYLIIHRYLHRYKLEKVNQEYNIRWKPHFTNFNYYFYCLNNFIIANTRNKYSKRYDYTTIYAFYNGGVTGVLPENY